MSASHAELVRERIKLQQEMREHFRDEGFDYEAYLNPPPGSWMERYHQRIREIDAILAPELRQGEGGAPPG